MKVRETETDVQRWWRGRGKDGVRKPDLHRELCSEERRETTGSHKGLRSELVLKMVYSATAGQTLRCVCCMPCPALMKQRHGSLILSQGSYRAQE